MSDSDEVSIDAALDPMRRAIELARQGEGFVEPNPMVGCVIVQENSSTGKTEIVGEGFHQRFGEGHAEVNALAMAQQNGINRASGATAYVTLEPCSHTGKTPPCADALIKAGVARVVVGCQDPFSKVNGRGIARLRKAGIECDVEEHPDAAKLIAPFRKMAEQKRPWVLAKWAMSLDGKIATHAGESQWISGPESRRIVHQIRGRVDGVLVGAGTLLADDPMLNARPAGARAAARIVLADSRPLPDDCLLFESANQKELAPKELGPVLLAVAADYPSDLAKQHEQQGVEVWRYENEIEATPIEQLLDELGRRQMTNLLVEGGGKLLGQLFDQQLVDEAHVFIAPKLIGGTNAPGPVGGQGIEQMAQTLQLSNLQMKPSGEDIYLHGRIESR